MIIASKISRRGMASVLHRHFGATDILVESAVFSWMRVLSPDYSGGGWNFYTLSNGGFFMSPDDEDKLFEVRSPNGFSAEVSAQDAGITAMLFALGELAFDASEAFQSLFSQHYHLLRDYVCDHDEKTIILQLID